MNPSVRGLSWLLALVGLVIASTGSVARAQGIGGLVSQLQGRPGAGTLVDAEGEARAIAIAERAFEYAATRRAQKALGLPADDSKELPPEYREWIAAAVQAFLKELRDELLWVKADGLLSQAELSEEISETRSEILDDFDGELDARIAGVAPPPKSGVSAMLRYVLLERNPPRRWLILAAWVLGAILLARLGSRLLRRLGGDDPWTNRLQASTLRGPLNLLALAAGLWIGRFWLWLPASMEAGLGATVALLAGWGTFWLWWKASSSLAGRVVRAVIVDAGTAHNEAVDVVRKALRLIGLLVFALLVAKVLFGADLTALLTGLGIVGVAASVAAQDTLRNLIASVTIHGDRPLSPGDLIRFEGQLGRVEEIGFRSTRLRTLDGPLVIIPNADLVRLPLENLSARTHLRHHYAIDLTYGTSPERVREAIEIVESVLGERDLDDDYGSHVVFHEFGAHSLRIELWYTSRTGDYFEAKRERGEINFEILRRFQAADLDFAFPTRTIHLAGAASTDAESKAVESSTS